MLIWVILFSSIAVGLFWYARHQPFPEHGNIAGSIFLFTALVLYIALGSPRPTAATVPPVLAIMLGGWFTIIGGYHMGRTQRDVIVAPFSGIILVSGIFGLVTLDWTQQTTTEQIGNFILASIFVLSLTNYHRPRCMRNWTFWQTFQQLFCVCQDVTEQPHTSPCKPELYGN